MCECYFPFVSAAPAAVCFGAIRPHGVILAQFELQLAILLLYIPLCSADLNLALDYAQTWKLLAARARVSPTQILLLSPHNPAMTSATGFVNRRRTSDVFRRLHTCVSSAARPYSPSVTLPHPRQRPRPQSASQSVGKANRPPRRGIDAIKRESKQEGGRFYYIVLEAVTKSLMKEQIFPCTVCQS